MSSLQRKEFGGSFESAFFATVLINGHENGESWSGTGFTVRYDPEPGINQSMIVSNRHVLKSKTARYEARFTKVSKDVVGPELGHVEDLVMDASEILFHSNPDIDLACLPSSWILQRKYFLMHLDESFFADFANVAIHAGMEVFFIGYPEKRYDTMFNLPLLRKGTIASLPWVDFEGNPEFILDAQVFPGSSGSPVFGKVDNNLKLLGVLARTYIRNSRLQVVPFESTLGTEEVIGLGIAIKSGQIADLILQAKSEWIKRFGVSSESVSHRPKIEK